MNKIIIASAATLFAATSALALWQKSALTEISERLDRIEAQAGVAPASSASRRTLAVEPDEGLTQRLAKLERAMSVRQGLALPAERKRSVDGSLSGVIANDSLDAQQQERGGNVAPEARAVVKDLVRNELQLREDERFEKRNARRLEQLVKRIETLADDNDIDRKTRGQMVTIMSAEREQISSFWREAREGNITRKEAHTKMSDVRTETDSNMKSILDEDQFAAYEQDRENDRHRPRPEKKKTEKPKTERE